MRYLLCSTCGGPACATPPQSGRLLYHCAAHLSIYPFEFKCMRCNRRNVVGSPADFHRMPLMTEAQILASTCDLSPDDSKPSGVSHAPLPLVPKNIPEGR